MRTLRILEHISLDGVIQAPGGPREDGQYPHGGWIVPFADPSLGHAVVTAHAAPFDLLLGRRTYDIWSAHWPTARGPIAEAFNAATKYVATRRPDSLAWRPAVPLGPDIAAEVLGLKASPGPDLILWGSSTLTPVLLEHGLADDITLFVYPVLLGVGKRVFADSAPPRGLELVSSTRTTPGVLINTYRPAGPLKTGSFPKPPG